ncbi:oligosaccharide flippase family protein [Flavobacterium sp. '19STA2R22 D10 B1']|uniref:oligosaccharide flippase family protein n=1 Tax=Flavobacterium aerium TaxID=3037261 RepID=UPI00278C4EE5|nr:oligosaccharide flippase family protein [Flavobacterium sp. '19STA2R22 D10 B1']
MIKNKIKLIQNNKKIKNFIIYGFGQAINLISPLLIIPYIVFICGEAGFGKIGLGISLAFFLILIVDYGSDIHGTKEVSINREVPEKIKEILVTVYSAKFLLLLFVILFTLLLVNFVPFFAEEKTLFFLSITMVIAQFINPIWFLQGVENYKLVTIINVGSKLIYVVSVFLVIKNPQDYIYANLCLGGGSFIANSLGFLWVKNKYDFHFKNVDWQKVKQLLRKDFSFCVSQLFLSLRQFVPIMLISYFGGYLMAGQYKILEQIIMLFRTYLQMFSRFFYASFCLELSKSTRIGIAMWRKFNGLNVIFILGLLLILFCAASYVLVFFKIDLESIDRLTFLLRIALLVPMFISLSLPLEQLMFGLNKNKIYIKIAISITVFNIILTTLLLPRFELLGVITSLIVTEALFVVLYYIILKGYFKKG